MLLDERYGRKLQLERLWTGSHRGLGVACGTRVSGMGKGQMRAMIPGNLALKQPLTEAVELS